MRSWFLQPTRDMDVINRRQESVSFLSAPQNQDLSHHLVDSFKHIVDISKIIVRIKSMRASVNDWLNFHKTAVYVIRVIELFKIQPDASFLVPNINMNMGNSMNQLLNILDGTIDFELIKTENRLVFREGVNPELDELRDMYSSLDYVLESIGEKELERYPFIDSLRILYLPQIGFEIAIPIPDDPSSSSSSTSLNDNKNVVEAIQGSLSNYQFNYQFHTHTTVYFKNQCTDALDEHYGDIHHRIVDKEFEISLQVIETISQFVPDMLYLINLFAELDCLVSFAKSALEYSMVRPKMTNQNVIYIKNGRHLLQEICVSDVFIPNDTSIANGREGSMKIVTGPNYSGKSVYLKQVGLITFMAHIGSFVPAEAALIGLTDNIFTRIVSNESVSVDKSSFVIDCQQISKMISTSTERSLLLIDEFGKGTLEEGNLVEAYNNGNNNNAPHNNNIKRNILLIY
eukprot:TRINITY_DN4382_c0_g2_i1.p1 TRINITY_DN4382_c0_g2~~TRINITY_DN4382_c0_g2_i1.p1  ORF type:complete len:458 (-),score=74.65 TRINITY_DN4382_c0_g2_i1:117-1490(-)